MCLEKLKNGYITTIQICDLFLIYPITEVEKTRSLGRSSGAPQNRQAVDYDEPLL